MKKIKLLGIFLLGFATLLTSCDKNDVDASVDGESALVDMMFLATGADSTGVMRGHRGHCNLTEVAVADLSSTITSYITANYSGATIDRAGTNAETGNTMVKITLADGTHAGLIFDKDGTFLEAKTHKGKGTEVATADLPTAITAYITANYATATIAKARVMEDSTYGVLLSLADETYLGVGFDANGAFVSEFSMKDKKGNKHGKGKKKGPFGQ
jgi:hypothetical protein